MGFLFPICARKAFHLTGAGVETIRGDGLGLPATSLLQCLLFFPQVSQPMCTQWLANTTFRFIIARCKIYIYEKKQHTCLALHVVGVCWYDSPPQTFEAMKLRLKVVSLRLVKAKVRLPETLVTE